MKPLFTHDEYHNIVKDMTDEQYLGLILESVEHPYVNGIKMPGFPSEEIQKQFVGSSKEHALREGHHFYLLVKKYCDLLGVSLNSNSCILDFGCGWGRIARYFFKDVERENFFGVDVDKGMIDFCTAEMGHGTYITTTPAPPTILKENCFDVIYAYSVFSHLHENVAMKWIEEFARILKPGGLLIATTEGRSFLDYCESLRAKGQDLQFGWHKALSESFIPVEKAKQDYDDGKFLFSPTGGGGVRDAAFYGEAIIPNQYIKNNYSRFLTLCDFFDDPGRLPQALFVMQKP